MNDTEWFEGESVERAGTILPKMFWLACLAVLAFILAPLYGCAVPDAKDPKVCFVQFLGNTQEGYTVIAQSCMTPDEFRESQK